MLNWLKNKLKPANIVYAFVCNIPVSACLCLASNVFTNNGTFIFKAWLFDYSISLPTAILISLFIPLVRIGKWFTKLFGVKNDTYTNNFHYRVLGTLAASIVYFLILNPVLATANAIKSGNWVSFQTWFFSWFRCLPFMLTIGFISSLIFDIPAYQLAHKIDKEF